MNCTFSRNNYKNTRVWLNEQCLDGTAWKKLFKWKIIPPKWGLTSVDVRSQLGGMNPFSYKRFTFAKWNTPFCQDLRWDVSPGWDDFSHRSISLNWFNMGTIIYRQTLWGSTIIIFIKAFFFNVVLLNTTTLSRLFYLF